MNKKIIIIFIFIGVLSIFIYVNSPRAESLGEIKSSDLIKNVINGPRIDIEPKTFDLGEVIFGDVAEHVFVVKNIGDKPLNILRLSTSCGCTSVEMAEGDKVISPGGQAEMKVSFDPAVHKEDSVRGIIEKSIYVRTNDSENSEVEVVIQANIIDKQ